MSLYELENTITESHQKYENKDMELLELIFNDDAEFDSKSLDSWKKRHDQLTNLILSMKGK